MVLTVDYENWLKKLKKNELRDLNEEFFIFEPVDRLWGTFFNSLDISDTNNFFTGHEMAMKREQTGRLGTKPLLYTVYL